MAIANATDGVRLYYETAGNGTPIVFVHEFGGSRKSKIAVNPSSENDYPSTGLAANR